LKEFKNNTASVEGLGSKGPGGATYSVAKHGVVALSEVLKRSRDLPKNIDRIAHDIT